jgi:flagellar biosynthesis anti-sigma factor FlgM
MALTLNSIDVGGAATTSTRQAAATQAPSPDSPNGSPQPQSGVSITSTASLLARLQQVLAAQSPVDPKRVDAISRALAAGTYGVHADRIAQGLIQVERSLGQLTEI